MKRSALLAALAAVGALGAPIEKQQAGAAVAVLAKGRTETTGYGDLIERTLAVARQSWSTKFDHLIFHEGNIPMEHQRYIQSEVPSLDLQFISVRDFFEPTKLRATAIVEAGGTANSRTYGCDPVQAQGSGYKAMCAFWYASFSRYTKKYTHLLRIDEDCVIDESQPDPLVSLGEADIAAPTWWYKESADLSKGMSPFFRLLANRSGHAVQFPEPGRWRSPYSNVMMLSLRWLRRMRWVIDAVAQSECILSNRWGDMPLWGATLRLAKHQHNGRYVNLPLSYLHKSHEMHVRPLFRSDETVRLDGRDVINTNLSDHLSTTRLDRGHGDGRLVKLIRVQGREGEVIDLLSNGVPPTQGRFRNVFTQTATPHMRDSPTLAEMLTCGRNAGICKHLRHNLDGWSLLLGMSVSASLCAAFLLIHQVNKFR